VRAIVWAVSRRPIVKRSVLKIEFTTAGARSNSTSGAASGRSMITSSKVAGSRRPVQRATSDHRPLSSLIHSTVRLGLSAAYTAITSPITAPVFNRVIGLSRPAPVPGRAPAAQEHGSTGGELPRQMSGR
jgi:hypothetical protein